MNNGVTDMLTLTNKRYSYLTGKATATWEVVKAGVCIGTLAHGSEAFANWRFLSADGSDYRTFKSKTAALAALA